MSQTRHQVNPHAILPDREWQPVLVSVDEPGIEWVRSSGAACGWILRPVDARDDDVGMRIRGTIGTRLRDEDRGDVPGWVLISLMTAGLVIAIWAIAGPALGAIFESALARVTGF